MLRISMKIGQYFTVGEDTVVQFDNLTGERVHLTVTAPEMFPFCAAMFLNVREASGLPA